MYRVLDVQGPGGVIVTVQKESAPRGEKRVVHRNMILPCEMLDAEEMRKDVEDPPRPMKEDKPQQSNQKRKEDIPDLSPDSNSESDGDSDVELLGERLRQMVSKRFIR